MSGRNRRKKRSGTIEDLVSLLEESAKANEALRDRVDEIEESSSTREMYGLFLEALKRADVDDEYKKKWYVAITARVKRSGDEGYWGSSVA